MNDVILLKDENSLLQFCRSHKKIFLYGAGTLGGSYHNYLKYNDIYVVGFIVTSKNEETYLDLPVFEAAEIISKINDDCGIILSLSSKFHNEILKRYSFPCQIGFCDDVMINVFYINNFLKLLDRWQNKFYPPLIQDVSDGQKILIVQIEHTYGDVIWSTGFLRELRRNFPNSHITMILNSTMTSLFRYCPYIDEFIGYELNRNMYLPCSIDDCESAMRFCVDKKLSYDVVYLPRLLPLGLYELWENLFLAIGSGACIRIAHITVHSKYMSIIAEKFEKFFTKLIIHETGEHEALRKLKLLGEKNIKKYEMELWLGKDEVNFSKNVFKTYLNGKSFFIAVGLVGSNPARSWSSIKYNQMIRTVIKEYPNVLFVFLGGSDAIDAAQRAKSEVEKNCIDLTGKTTLLQAAAVVSMCDFYIGADTGLMHMASAFNKPVIELSHSLPDSPETYGSHPTRTGPWCVKGIILKPPHGLDECKYVCSKKYSHCINLIEVGDVLKAIKTLVDFIKEENDK